jgi:hypothetical protein
MLMNTTPSIAGSFHQLDLTTPGISPLEAIVLKHMRQIPNFLKKALGRPQMGQRLYWRVENFGFLRALAISDFFAKFTSLLLPEGHSE